MMHDTYDSEPYDLHAGMAVTFRVANSRTVTTAANYRLHDTSSVVTMLQWILGHMTDRMRRVRHTL